MRSMTRAEQKKFYAAIAKHQNVGSIIFDKDVIQRKRAWRYPHDSIIISKNLHVAGALPSKKDIKKYFCLCGDFKCKPEQIEIIVRKVPK